MATIHYNSKEIKPGDTFICLPKGEPYIDDALKNGACNIQHMTRKEMAMFSADHYQDPSKQLTVIGVTGTNGKTTVTHLIHQFLEKSGFNSKVLGTLNAKLTTPESLDIQKAMAQHHANGGTHFVMEVSSHGIDQHRIDCIDFNLKLLTNISQDHLDYHPSFTHYKETKYRFLNNFPGHTILPEYYNSETLPHPSPLLGTFNTENMNAAYCACKYLGLTDAQLKNCIKTATAPPGRFEQIDQGQDFSVIVDYAHTPDGLENVLKTARELTPKTAQLICVFGCGGDRDRSKRPKMGTIASTLSDIVIITNDNPRQEDPQQILNDIISELPHTQKEERLHIELDRKLAIEKSIALANTNDIILIAGKGHEDYQILKSGTISFDDRKIARNALENAH